MFFVAINTQPSSFVTPCTGCVMRGGGAAAEDSCWKSLGGDGVKDGQKMHFTDETELDLNIKG